METAVLYARFSCDKQRDQSIEDQLRECREYCTRRGWKVVREYSDRAMSGRNDHRPQFLLMVKNAGEADRCVVWQRDRFSRNVEDSMRYERELLAKGCTLESCKESMPDESDPASILMKSIYAGLAEMESRKTAIRTKRGMRGSALKCEYMGYRVFGYRVDPATNKYEIDPDEAAIVREVFARRIGHESINSISRDLASRGVLSSRGRPCGYTMVYTMCHNENYIGVYTWDDVRIEGGMPRIISDDTFSDAQGVVSRKSRTAEVWDEYPLSGKAVCGACGAALKGVSGRGSAGKKYLYYACGKSCKETRNIRKEELEAAIVDGVREMLSDPDEAMRIAKMAIDSYDDSEHDAKLNAAQDSLKQALDGQKNIMRAIEQGVIMRGVNERLMELQLQEDRARREIAALDVETTATPEDVASYLQHGATLTDDDILMLFVYRAIVTNDYIMVVLNTGEPDGEAKQIEFSRCSTKVEMVPHSVTIVEHMPVLVLSRAA